MAAIARKARSLVFELTMTKPWKKDTTDFVEHPASLELNAELLRDFITPNHRFFVCNHVPTPTVSTDGYTLKVGGDGIEQPLELSYEALLKLPSRSVISYLECAGSQRNLYLETMGKQSKSDDFAMTPWMLGGVGNAVWTGVSLRTVLEMAGVKADAVDVNAQGLDTDAPEGGVNRPIPLAKALDPDTLIAYFMNGDPLPPDHGYPLRLIVPGWVGTNSVKWLGSITVSTEKVWCSRNIEHYVFIGDEWPPEQYAPALGAPITTQNIKSSLALPWKAELSVGKQVMRGVARSPHAIIEKVEWSCDDGATWQAATLVPPLMQYAWARFEFEWDAPAGKHTIMTRATDVAGNTQPMTQPFNREGYLFNRVYAHPVTVT